MRILGLDYGSKTVGVAVSDPLGFTAQGVEIIRRKSENKMRQTLARIEELIAQYQVEEIVLGLPKNMNNTLGDRAEKSLELKETLERRTGLPVVMWDERLTTVSANRVLMETGVRRENRKEHVDEIAAVFILQGYLDYPANRMKKQDGRMIMDKIKFVTDEGETVEFYVEEQTRVNGTDYLLVTDSMDDEANAYILKDSSEETDPEADYVMVEDDVELEAMSKVFSQMMDDVDIEM